MEKSYLQSIIKQFAYYKTLGEQAMLQLADEDLFSHYIDESNSIAIIVAHLSGNMQSRFTDFLTTDGEKPWRNRDDEFTNTLDSRDALIERWSRGWGCLFETLESLTEQDLSRIVYIRNDGHTVIEAVNRQLAHYPYHIGQIVYIAKMIKGQQWKSLSIPRNKSAQYNQRKFNNNRERRHFTDDL